jgi:hypothetical protein
MCAHSIGFVHIDVERIQENCVHQVHRCHARVTK